GAVTLTVTAADNVGVTAARAEITKPDGTKTSVDLPRATGTPASGLYRGTFSAPANATRTAQVFHVTFFARDAAGNEGKTVTALQFTVAASTGGGSLGRLAVSPTTLSFGQKTVGSRTKLTVQVSNAGTGPLDVT